MKRLSLLFTRFFSEASGVWGAPGGTVGPECGHGHSHTSPEACSPPRPPALPGALAPSVPRGASSSSPLSSPLVSPRCSQPTGTSTGFSRSCERVAGWSGIVGDANRAGGQPWSTASSPPPGTHQPADDPPDSPGPLLDGGLLVRLQQELVTRHSAELAGVAAGWGGGDRDPWGPLQRPGGPRHSRGGALLPPQWGAPGVPLTQGVSLCPPPPPGEYMNGTPLSHFGDSCTCWAVGSPSPWAAFRRIPLMLGPLWRAPCPQGCALEALPHPESGVPIHSHG